MHLFDEGSPKQSHRLLVRMAMVLGLLMAVTSCDAHVTFYGEDESTVLGLGGLMASGSGVVIPLLLLAWRRGIIAGNWPFPVSFLLAAGSACFLAGEWYYAQDSGDTFEASLMFYPTLLLATATAAVCATGVIRRPVDESGSTSLWVSSRRDS